MLINEVTWLSALILGLMGGTHCAGMCGGIVTALSLGSDNVGTVSRPVLRYVLAYNLGRITSYVIAGMLIGGLGAVASNLVFLHYSQLVLKMLAAIFMLLMGLYLGGWWSFLSRLEAVGGYIWKRLEPVGRRFIPVRTVPQAYMLGMVWGWLPCGLVYTALIYSSAAGSAFSGSMIMLFFGLGTLPLMVAMGLAGASLQRWLQQQWLRRAAGLLVIGFAGVMVYEVVKLWVVGY